jgi:hypothetical protein
VKLDGLARGLNAEPAQPDLGRRDQDAAETVAVARARRHRTFETESERRLELGEEVDELLADQGEIDEQPALRPSVMSPDRALEERAAGDAETHERDTEPGTVDHLHHPAEPTGVGLGATAVTRTGRAQRIPERVVELDLARRHALRAQFGLESPHRDPVAGAVLALLGNEVEAEAGGAVGRALGTRQHHDGGAVDVGTEPLLAVDHDAAVADIARRAVHGAA